MTEIEQELAKLDGSITTVLQAGMAALGGAGARLFAMDHVMMAAVKRSLSLTSGIGAMVKAQNMVCARALLRMHLDTVSRFLAYTYVENSGNVATGVMGGAPLNRFKSSDGKRLTDGYLVERMSRDHPWVSEVYKRTSGYVHFSESQFFDAIRSLSGDEERTLSLQISQIDDKFPETSWIEVVSCFRHLTGILLSILKAYEMSKAMQKGPAVSK